jgi:hypothetical protein
VAGVGYGYLYPGVGSLGAAYVDLTAAPVVLDCVREYVDEDLLQSLVKPMTAFRGVRSS